MVITARAIFDKARETNKQTNKQTTKKRFRLFRVYIPCQNVCLLFLFCPFTYSSLEKYACVFLN